MATNNEAQLEVIQEDREAAAALLVLGYRADGMSVKLALGMTNPVCDGLADHSDEVQAFARHRLTTQSAREKLLVEALQHIATVLSYRGAWTFDEAIRQQDYIEDHIRLTLGNPGDQT